MVKAIEKATISFAKKHHVIPSKHDALKEYYTSNELQNREFAPRVLNLQSL